MSDVDALLAAIASNVDEDTPRLAYADWLDENGTSDADHARAEFIRVQIELARSAKDDARRELEARAKELREAHQIEWLRGAGPVDAFRWSRGFVNRVFLDSECDPAFVTSWGAVPTLETVCLHREDERNDDSVADMPVLPNLRDFCGFEVSVRSLPLIGRWTTLQRLDLIHFRGNDRAQLAHLAALYDLRELMLVWDRLTDAGLPHLARLVKLENLNLNFTSVSGSGLAILSNFPNLRNLALSYVPLTDDAIPHIVGCRSLEGLTIPTYNGTAGPFGDRLVRALPQLPKLRALNISRGDVTREGFRELARLTNLEELTVGGPNFGDAELAHLAGLTKLRRLKLDNSPLSAGLGALATLPELRALEISAIDVGGTAALGQLTSLRWLNLQNTCIRDDDLVHLANLSNLEVLDLGSTQVSDAGLRHLRHLPKLRRLKASNTRITQEAWERRAEWPPNLDYVFLGDYSTDEPLYFPWDEY